jgi:small subunit ribosomal protein S5
MDNNSKPMHKRPRPEEKKEEKQFDERVINIDRVARVVKGGRRFRFRALVVIGDHKKQVGVGSAKGADVTTAVTKATEVAKKHLVKIAIYKGTVPHEAEGKVSGAHILIKPASPGTGLIAGGVVRIILEVAGIRDALSKSLGSTNKTNAAYATIAALQSIKPASEWRRNIKIEEAEPEKPAKAVETKIAEPKAAEPKVTAPKKVVKKAVEPVKTVKATATKKTAVKKVVKK